MSRRPAKLWRRMNPGTADPDAPGASYTAGDPLANKLITDREVFWATVTHAAALAGVDPGHLATALRLGAVPGEVCTARRIHDAAGALAGAGYRAPPPPPPRGPSAAELARDLASLGGRGAAHRGPRGERAPRRPRGRPPKPRPSQGVPAFGARARAMGII
jgi:hypothetical protein